MLHFFRPFLEYRFPGARGHVRFSGLSHNDSLVSPGIVGHDFVRRLRVAVSGWYRRVARARAAPHIHAHTHTHTHKHILLAARVITRSSFGLYLSPEVQESASYVCVCTRVYRTINSRSLSLPPFGPLHTLRPLSLVRASVASLSASRFRGWPSWPAFTARARSECHRG